MESQPQNTEFRINPENIHPCRGVISVTVTVTVTVILMIPISVTPSKSLTRMLFKTVTQIKGRTCY